MLEDDENLLSYSKAELKKEAYQIEAQEIGLKKGFEKGIEKGIQQNKIVTAKKLL